GSCAVSRLLGLTSPRSASGPARVPGNADVQRWVRGTECRGRATLFCQQRKPGRLGADATSPWPWLSNPGTGKRMPARLVRAGRCGPGSAGPLRSAQPAERIFGHTGLDCDQRLAQALGVAADAAIADLVFPALVNEGADAGEDGGGAGQGRLAGADPVLDLVHGEVALQHLVAEVAGQGDHRVTGHAVEEGAIQRL